MKFTTASDQITSTLTATHEIDDFLNTLFNPNVENIKQANSNTNQYAAIDRESHKSTSQQPDFNADPYATNNHDREPHKSTSDHKNAPVDDYDNNQSQDRPPPAGYNISIINSQNFTLLFQSFFH